MSQAEVERFVNNAEQDTALREALKPAGSDLAAAARIAKDKGYDFTGDELNAYVEGLKGELSEEQLEKAAGGSANYIFVTVHLF